jgi:uncharacterized repeat protein (TIGR01451 family)
VFGWASPAAAQNCAPATSQGTAPPSWQTYCWINLSTYNDTTARTAAGQAFSITLTDGSTLSFRIRNTGTPGIVSIAAPSWTGAAVGNTAFLGIPGRPILYQQAGGQNDLTISNITVTPPPGVPAVTAYSFVVADAESSNNGESLRFVTNGSAWTILDQVNPISGSTYPIISGAGTTQFDVTGVAGRVGAYIVGSNSPTTINVRIVGGGLQGVMFAVRFASIRLTKVISGARVDPADQFQFQVRATGSGAVLGTGTTSGTGLGPFNATAVSLASGLPLSLVETMAPGSVTPLSDYESRLTCTNGTAGSTTPLPTNVLTTSYSLGALQFGDALICTFTNRPFPHLRISKLLGAGGRQFSTDQFTVRIRNGSTVAASTTTSGTGSTVTNGATPMTRVSAGTAYTLDEIPAGSMADLSQYTQSMTCTNANASSSTALGTGYPRTITPALGDVITCALTNTRLAGNANLVLDKTSLLLSDPVTGSVSPFHIPGAEIRYRLRVYNSGNLAADAGSVYVYDTLPPGVAVNTTGAFTFTNGAIASGLSFNPATDVRFSNSAAVPASFAACTYTPVTQYDAAVRHVCFRLTGTMAAATAAGQPSFTIAFDTRVQ